MPGIVGLVGTTADASLQEPMLARMAHKDWYVRHHWVNEAGGVALGRVSLGFVNTAPQPASIDGGAKRAVLDGEIYDYSAHRQALIAKGRIFSGDSHAELLLHGLEAFGTGFLRTVNGCFSAAVWDSTAGTLRLMNDRFGMRPLYWSHLPGRLLFGSEVKAIFVDCEVSRATDPRGLAQFFTFGHYLNNETSYSAVALLPAAGVLTYSVADDRVELDHYSKLGDSWKLRSASTGELLDRIDEAFARSVERCSQGSDRLGLSLSGGLDARTILGVVPDDRPLKTLCLGMEGSIDVQCATEMAQLTNRQHLTHTLDTKFLADFEGHMRYMVHLTDGQYLCQCIVMPTLPIYRKLGIDVLLRGHAGELMHMTKAYNFSLNRETLSITSDGVEGWLWKRLQAHMLEGVEGDLFTPAFGTDITGIARDSLRNALKEAETVEPPAHRIWHMFLSQRIRRETGLSMAEFGSVVETRLPYLDTDLLDALMAAPPELKLAEAIQTHIIRKRRPSFLNVVNANTGARMDAGPFAKSVAKLRLKVCAKLGLKGYQPYERLGLWLRRELRPMVEKLLLDDRCLSRGVFKAETVRTAVANHIANKRNHTFLLMAMMIFELGQREFVDSDADTKRSSPVLAGAN
jgi:asparagine synthase (glutamine-hydrolysing)